MLKIYKFFDKNHKYSLVFLLFLISFSATADLISVFFIAYVLSNLLNPESLNLEPFLDFISIYYTKFFMDNVLIFAISAVLISLIFRLALIIKMQKFSAELGTHFSKKAFKSFYRQKYEKIETTSSSLLTSTLTNKITSISVGTVFPTLNIISNLTTLCLMLGAALMIDFSKVSLIVTAVAVTYLAIYLISQNFKKIKSKAIAENLKRVAMVSENSNKFSSQIVLKKSDQFFLSRLKFADERVRKSQAALLILASTPRYILESVIWITIFLIFANLDLENSEQAVANLVFIAVAFQRIMPGIQQVYTNFTTISSHEASVRDVLNLLDNTITRGDYQKQIGHTTGQLKSFKISGFKHHKLSTNQKGNSLEINFPSWTLVTGPSGKGKSTLLKMVAGLYEFDFNESICIIEAFDKKKLVSKKIPADKIHTELQGQDILDGTVLDNLQFTSHKQLCMKSVYKVLETVELGSILQGNSDQLNCINVKKLSGGERQRLAIARAILSGAEFILLDETTSGLDPALERRILINLKKEYTSCSLLMIAHNTPNSDLFTKIIKL